MVGEMGIVSCGWRVGIVTCDWMGGNCHLWLDGWEEWEFSSVASVTWTWKLTHEFIEIVFSYLAICLDLNER